MMRTHPDRGGSSEKSIQRDIVRALEQLGADVTSTSQPQRALLTRGIPDLYVRHARWQMRFWIEVKRPGGRTSAPQRTWHEREHAAGGCVLVVHGLAGLVEGLIALGAPIR